MGIRLKLAVIQMIPAPMALWIWQAMFWSGSQTGTAVPIMRFHQLLILPDLMQGITVYFEGADGHEAHTIYVLPSVTIRRQNILPRDWAFVVSPRHSSKYPRNCFAMHSRDMLSYTSV